jgi:hypothetical protein
MDGHLGTQQTRVGRFLDGWVLLLGTIVVCRGSTNWNVAGVASFFGGVPLDSVVVVAYQYYVATMMTMNPWPLDVPECFGCGARVAIEDLQRYCRNYLVWEQGWVHAVFRTFGNAKVDTTWRSLLYAVFSTFVDAEN